MFIAIVGAVAVGAGAASRYGSSSATLTETLVREVSAALQRQIPGFQCCGSRIRDPVLFYHKDLVSAFGSRTSDLKHD
jgi:hypothetical protein